MSHLVPTTIVDSSGSDATDVPNHAVRVNVVAGGAGGGASTIADGADVAQGSTADAAWVSGAGTVIALLKKIASAGGSAVSIADGADVATGAKADAAWTSGAGSVISILKAIASAGGTSSSTVTGAISPGSPLTIPTIGMNSLYAIETTGGADTVELKGSVDGSTYNVRVPFIALDSSTIVWSDHRSIGSLNTSGMPFNAQFQASVAGLRSVRMTSTGSGSTWILATGTATIEPPHAVIVRATDGGQINSDGTGSLRVAVTNTPAVQSAQLPVALAANGGLKVEGVAGGVAVPVSGTLAVTSAGLTNLDVALSTRTKPADQQHAIIDSGTTTVTQATGTNLHVVVDTAPTTAVTGPLTDTQLRATPVPVSGTVTANAGTNLNTSLLALDATQTNRTAKAQVTDGTRDGTVKAASTTPLLTDTALVVTQRDPIPAGTNVIGHVIADTGSTTAVTGNVAVTNAGLTNLDVALSTRTKPADQQHAIIDSGTTTVTQATGTNLHVVVDSAPSTAVTGPLTDTQLRATPVPVSGTVAVTSAGLTNLDVALSTRLKPADTLTGVTTVAAVTSITNPVTVAQATPANLTATVTPIAITKGTQGATGFTTQDLKDAGRVRLSFYANAVASGTTTTETMITLTKSADQGATSTGSSFVVTSGKRFRITSITVASRGNATATIQISTFALRINTAGAAIATSTPLILAAATATAAVASAWDRASLTIPDGFEILGDGTLQFGISANAVFVTNAPTWYVNIIGYEY